MDFSGFDLLIDTIAEQLHSGKLKPEQLNQELITATYNELNTAGGKGYGKDWIRFPGDGKGTLPNELKKNIYAFSGAKTYAQLEALNNLLYDSSGRLLPFNEFSQIAKKIGHRYNKNYLQAEYQTARTAAQMAQKWQELQKTKHLFPNLKFRTVGDERVRHSHQELNGIIQPIDSDFWKKYYPPLDYRCRCDVVATAENSTEYKEERLPEPIFKGNVGKDKEIFTNKGSFFKLAKTNRNAFRNIELSKLNAPYQTVFKAKNGKKVEVNLFADPRDLEDNINTAKVITEQLNINVFIRPHLDANIVSTKNPEYLINGKLSDLKSKFKNENYKSINSAFKAARTQKVSSIVFDFTKSFSELNIIQVNRLILSNINKQRGKQFSEIIFVYKNKAVKVGRDTIVKKELLKELEKLKANS